MKVSLHSEFIADLINIGDGKVPSRVLRKLFDKGGNFIEQAKGDHRYEGIEDAWIRYVSQGGPAFRVIFTRAGEEVLVYRAGPHAVEDHLVAPADHSSVSVVENEIAVALRSTPGNHQAYVALAEAQASGADEEVALPGGVRGRKIFQNHAERFLYSNMLGRRFLPHRDVYLMSPYLSFDLLQPTHLFGQMLDELVEGGATVWLISKPPRAADLENFKKLASRRINVFFCEDVHAKVYAFILNRDQLKPDQRQHEDLVVLGSANLTWSGINPDGLRANRIQYELSYDVPKDDWEDVEKFLLHVAGLSTELDVLRANLVEY